MHLSMVGLEGGGIRCDVERVRYERAEGIVFRTLIPTWRALQSSRRRTPTASSSSTSHSNSKLWCGNGCVGALDAPSSTPRFPQIWSFAQGRWNGGAGGAAGLEGRPHAHRIVHQEASGKRGRGGGGMTSDDIFKIITHYHDFQVNTMKV